MNGLTMLDGMSTVGSECYCMSYSLFVDVIHESPEDKQSIQTMQSVQQMRNEQAKILQSFNTPKYSILVCIDL